MTAVNVTNNTAASRYEMTVDGHLCVAAYEHRSGAVAFTHTEVPDALSGRGIASRLIGAALADVRRQGLMAIPLCPFVAAYIDKHPDVQDLLASGAPG